MPIDLTTATLNMIFALTCGALIGSERQIRQRMAGLRTNALVALGSAGFVVFSQLVPHDASPTRVAAQVVSGIGFLGAGIIFRDGFNVHGLNTAATLWCSAAVGVLSGIAAWPFALVLTILVVFINLGLRPLVKWLKRHTRAGVPVVRHYRIVLQCATDQEAVMRGVLLRGLVGLHLQEIEANFEADSVQLVATIASDDLGEAVESAVQRLAAEPGVRSLRWMPADEV